MGVSMAAFTTFIEQFSDVLWNSLLLFLLVGTGVYFTVRLRGVQVRRFGEGFRRVFGGFTLRGKKADAEGMSSFQALTTAIAAQVGTGNITGCATALVSGGPGALFWTWVSAFFGMATIYAEAVLAQHYKTTVNGQVTGGPAYYIRAAFKGKVGKVLATVFSVLIILALGFMGNMVQSNSIGDAFHNAFGLNRLAVGVVVAAIAAFIFLGGVQRIAAVTEKVVPIMAAFYILGCIAILVINAKALPGALAQVFVLAFEPQAMAGGIAGVTVQQSMRFGVARGLFSNEAGLGSTPHAHALAKVERPQDQGAVAILGVFVDTFVVLTLTGLVLITSGLIPQGMTGTALTQAAFSQAFGGFGPIFIAVCMFFFAFSTIIGWYFFGQTNFKALFGDDVDVFLVPLGTGANVLGFNRMIRSWHSILCSDMAHTHTSESGAVEAVVGCKMTPIPSVHGKISAGALSAYLTDMGSPHHSQPGLVALTQSTEVATVYTPEEIKAIVDVAHANGLFVHMDGARIANAAVALGCDVRSFTKDLGVDMMSFGGTKNGMMMAESVVVFNKDFVRDFVTLRKQNLQLASKMRFLAAQYIAYFKDGLWLENARHANNMARLLADLISGMPHVELAHPVESNGVFVNMKPEHIAALQRQYMFHEVEPSAHTVRWMLSFNTSEEQVRAFAKAIGALA